MAHRQTATHCANGHPWTEKSTYMDRGTKRCRICSADNQRFSIYGRRVMTKEQTEAEYAKVQAEFLQGIEDAAKPERSNMLGLRWLKPDSDY